MTELTRWADYLEQRLRRSGRPRRVEVYRATASTQDIAKPRASEPLLVVADHQSAGRGRLGRRWHAPAGTAVLMSLTHHLDPTRGRTTDHAAFLASLGAARGLERLLRGQRIGIKWPNDLMVHGRKLAGVLVEAVGRDVVIGIGINVSLSAQHLAALPAELRNTATSLMMLGREVDRVEVVAEVVEQVDKLLAAPTSQQAIDEWRDRSVLSNQRLRLRSEGRELTGTVLDLDPDEGLVIRRDSGEIVCLRAAATTVLG